MAKGEWTGRLVAAAVVVLTPACGARAADAFVETRTMIRHVGQDLPAVIPFGEVLSSPIFLQHRKAGARPYNPGLAEISGQASPLMGMAGYDGAGGTATQAVKAGLKVDDFAMGAALRNEHGHAYEDGAGTQVDHGFQRDSEYLAGRKGDPAKGALSFLAVRDTWEEARLPNYGMDLIRLEQGGMRVEGNSRPTSGWFDEVDTLLAWNTLHVDTDNFSMRAPASAKLNILINRQQWRTQVTAARTRGDDRTQLGWDLSYDEHDSRRVSREYGPDALTARRIPKVQNIKMGLAASHRTAVAEARLEGGLRYDLVSSSAEDAHERGQATGALASFYNLSPQQLWDQTYNRQGADNDRVEHNLSGRLRAEHPVAGATGFVDLSRMVRSADNGERYYALSGPVAALYQVGNPDIEPEKHHKVEVGAWSEGGGYKGYGLGSRAGAWKLSASLAQDWVEDFIAADRARNQQGVLVSNGGVVYRNVDVSLQTVTAEAHGNVSDSLGLRLNVTGARGRDVTDHRPLYQVAPLEANAFLDMFAGDADLGWNLGLHSRLVAAKKAVDDSTSTGSGQDTGGPAGAFALFNAYGTLRLGRQAAITAGVDNIFDKLYREHLMGEPQSPTTTVVNAPGRTVYVRGVLAF